MRQLLIGSFARICHNVYYRSVKPNYQKYKVFLCSFRADLPELSILII
jgi:hypothetical protein